MTNHKDNAAVTLVEMIVVVSILVILATFVFLATRRLDAQGKERDLEGVFLLLKSALTEYHQETGMFPVQADDELPEDADEALETAAEHGELMYAELRAIPASREILKGISEVFVKGGADVNDPLNVYDAWGGPLDYRYDPNVGNFPALISAGPDREFDTDDDISSKVK
jgi:prepilin-type N-terminal cleavage/methylation domain-containing protein